MEPVVKVLLVVIIVLVVMHILKSWMANDDVALTSPPMTETYARWSDQEFETVAPTAFAVTPSALVVNNQLTAMPALPMVQTAMPTAVPVQMQMAMPTSTPMTMQMPMQMPMSVTMPTKAPMLVASMTSAPPTMA